MACQTIGRTLEWSARKNDELTDEILKSKTKETESRDEEQDTPGWGGGVV